MVSYQYMPYLFNRKIHLLRLILCYCTSTYKKYIIVSCFICNNFRTFLISQISNQVLRDIFQQNIFLQRSKSNTSQKLWYTIDSKHWNTELYWGSGDCCEGDPNNNLNQLASVIVMQYTTVTNYSYWVTWTWTWSVWYLDCWYHFKKCPGRV